MVLAKLPEETKKNMVRDHSNNKWTVDVQASILKEIRI